VISFSGSASDPQDSTLPASALTWMLILHHCPSNCHEHEIQSWPGVAGESFTAPDHEYPSFLELRLTATDAGGLTDSDSVQLDPRTVDVTLESSPSGLQLTIGSTTQQAGFTRTVIEGSTNTVSAPSPQTLGGESYGFVSWSDGGAATHTIVANSTATYTATYQPVTSADLRLVKNGARSGTTATWTLALTNLGPDASHGVVVSDTLPSRLTYVSAPGCVYTASTRLVACSLASLPGGGAATFTIATTVTGKGNGWITNTAQVTSSTPDPATANNSSSARVR